MISSVQTDKRQDLVVLFIALLGFLYAITCNAETSSQSSQASPSEHVAMIISFQGSSKIIRSSSGSEIPTKIGQGIFIGDRILTGRTSNIKLLFKDETIFSLSGSTDLLINEYLFKKGSSPKLEVSISNGTFRFMAGKIAKINPENFKIKTTTASIGIRGSGGSGRTSDGTNGKLAVLEMVTTEGHVLEITTIAGESYVVDDPVRGVRVNAFGKGIYFQPERALFPEPNSNKQPTRSSLPIPIPSPSSQQPIEEHRSISLIRWKRENNIVTLKRVFTKQDGPIKEALIAIVRIPLIQLDFENQHDSNTPLAKEGASSVNMMLRLSENIVIEKKMDAESTENKPRLSFSVKRERGTAHTIMNKLAKEKMAESSKEVLQQEKLEM